MGVESGQAAAVVDHHIVAVAAVVLGGGDGAGQGGPDGGAGGYRQIHAGVAPGLPGEGVSPVTKLRGNTALPPGTNGGAEAVRPNEGHVRAGNPALRAGGYTIHHDIVDAVRIGLLLRCDLRSCKPLEVLPDLLEI